MDVDEIEAAEFTFGRLQDEQAEWSDRNFPGQRRRRYLKQTGIFPLLGCMEELGELAHGYLKLEQGIRGSEDELIAKQKDAVADIIIYLAAFCNDRGWEFERIVSDVWSEVAKRNWQVDPIGGVDKPPALKPPPPGHHQHSPFHQSTLLPGGGQCRDLGGIRERALDRSHLGGVADFDRPA